MGETTARLTISQSDLSKAARVLCHRVADECNVDKEDYWKCYGDGFIEDARAMFAAIGIQPQEPSHDRA